MAGLFDFNFDPNSLSSLGSSSPLGGSADFANSFTPPTDPNLSLSPSQAAQGQQGFLGGLAGRFNPQAGLKGLANTQPQQADQSPIPLSPIHYATPMQLQFPQTGQQQMNPLQFLRSR